MNEFDSSDEIIGKVLRVMLLILALGLVGLMLILSQTPVGAVWSRLFDAIFGASTGQMTWFITRASGIIAYLLLWLSTVWGLAVSSKMFDKLVPRAFTYDAHEYLSLLAFAFTFVHVAILLADHFMPFNVAQLFVPFISDYRPFWVGVGIIATYLSLLVTVTFYLRRMIGQRAFRVIHYLSFAGFLGVLVHSWFSGTDTGLVATRIMYLVTGLSVIFMTVYWLMIQRMNKTKSAAPKPTPVLPPLANPARAAYVQRNSTIHPIPRNDKRENPFFK
jgi:predicted ferric reductase